MDPNDPTTYQQNKHRSKLLAMRMRSGTGVNRIIGGEDSNTTHYIDALQRFQKDYSQFDRHKRQEEKTKRQQLLQRKRLQQLERQNKRWGVVQQNQQIQNYKAQRNLQAVNMGTKRTPTSNGLAYNPINLTYDRNPEGEKLKTLDEDNKIRGFVRAYNMDHNGNSVYNPLNGVQRRGVDKIVPNQLSDRYNDKLHQFEDNKRLKLPQTSNDKRRNIFHYY